MSEHTISKRDLHETTQRLKAQGQQAALAFFSREPVLAQHMADRTEALRQLLLRCGTRPAEMELVITAVVKLLMEAVLTMDRSHRQLMNGLLPDEDLHTRPVARPGEGHGDK